MTMPAGLMLPVMPFFDRNAFNQYVAHSTREVVINFVYLLKGTVCVIHLHRSLTVRIDPSITPTCSFAA